MVSKAREDWENESTRTGVQQTSSMTDTHALVTAVGMGKGLKGQIPAGGPNPGGMMVPPAIRPSGALPATSSAGGAQMTKAPSAVKTNIKSANQIHPYAR